MKEAVPNNRIAFVYEMKRLQQYPAQPETVQICFTDANRYELKINIAYYTDFGTIYTSLEITENDQTRIVSRINHFDIVSLYESLNCL